MFRSNHLRPSLLLAAPILTLVGMSFSAASEVRVLTVDETRSGVFTNPSGAANFNFATGDSFQLARGALLDPANFGPTGIIPGSVKLSAVPDLSALTRANTDVLILPLLTRGDFPNSYSASEIAAVASFLNAGGGLFAFSNTTPIESLFRTLFGVTGVSFPLSSHNAVTIADTDSPILSGPFGSIPASCVIPFFDCGYFTDVGSGTPLLKGPNGEALAATFTLGAGRAALFSDEEAFIDAAIHCEMLVTGQLAPSSDSLKLFLNTFASVIPDQGAPTSMIPEPGTAVSLLSGLLVLACRRLGRRSGPRGSGKTI